MISQNLKINLSTAYDRESKNRNDGKTQKWKILERSHFLQQLNFEDKKSFLEVGAGPGKDSFFFSQNGLDVLATDLSEEMVKHCRSKKLKADVMSFDHLDFPDDSFDSVWALNCLLHVPKRELPLVLKEIKRVLKNDGLFYMGVYGGIDHEGIWEDDFHEPKRFFSFYEDAALKECLIRHFMMETFHKIPMEHDDGGPPHFQGFIVRK